MLIPARTRAMRDRVRASLKQGASGHSPRALFQGIGMHLVYLGNIFAALVSVGLIVGTLRAKKKSAS